jgi:hypothetical protein
MKNGNFSMPERCTHLLWARPWAPQGSAIESMLGLRADLLRRAQERGVRKALFYSAGWLVEWIEGMKEAVGAEWEQARASAADGAALFLHRSEGIATLSEPVQLASLHAGEKSTDVARRMHHLIREHQEGWLAEPWEVWQALSAPCQLGTTQPLHAVARRDVLALASDDNAAVDLLRRLAQASDVRVSYQRFAGSDLARGDVGAAYVDAPSGAAAITRVQALSRRALGHGVTLFGLRNVVRMVVLLGADVHRGGALLGELGRLLQALQRRVDVHVVSQLGATHAAAAQVLGGLVGVRICPVQSPASGDSALAVVTALLAAPPHDNELSTT